MVTGIVEEGLGGASQGGGGHDGRGTIEGDDGHDEEGFTVGVCQEEGGGDKMMSGHGGGDHVGLVSIVHS